jgi:predicted RNase H-like HicB family nuclease
LPAGLNSAAKSRTQSLGPRDKPEDDEPQEAASLSAQAWIALIHKDHDSGYGVSFPDVPGVITVADTLDEALVQASEVLAFAFEDWQGALPNPRSLEVLRRDPEFLELSEDAVVAAVRPSLDLVEAA